MGKFRDLSGNQYGKLKVICKTDKRSSGSVVWECLCVCGNTVNVKSASLCQGLTKSCGCFKGEYVRIKNTKNICGEIFGRLTVLECETIDNTIIWKCICECGCITYSDHNTLTSGHKKSCGCLQKDKIGELRRTHGLSGTPEYTRAVANKRNEKKRQIDSDWLPVMEKELSKFQPVCVVCGSNRRLCTDHVLPMADNNGLYPGNAVKLCTVCNSTKWKHPLDHLPADWKSKILTAAEDFRCYWEMTQVG